MARIPARYRKDDLHRDFYVGIDHEEHVFVGTLSRDPDAAWKKLVNSKRKNAHVASEFEEQMREEGYRVIKVKLTDLEQSYP